MQIALRTMWVAWRQQRAALIVLGLLAAALAAALVVRGIQLRSTFASLASNHCGAQAAPPVCFTLFGRTGSPTSGLGAIALNAVPVLFGMFAGVPLFSRELESGTLRFACTQGISRAKWAASRLALAGAGSAAIGCGLGLVGLWWLSTSFRDSGLSAPHDAYWAASLAGVTPLTLTGWALFGVLLGACMGAVIGRTVPAIAAAAAACSGAALGGAWLRDAARHINPLVQRADPGVVCGTSCTVVPGQTSVAGGETIGGWFTLGDGHRISVAAAQSTFGPPFSQRIALSDNLQAWLAKHHLNSWVAYQPASRYWLFQWAEFGVLLTASALVFALAVWVICRRSA